MKFKLTEHAKLRMQQRGITVQMVNKCITEGKKKKGNDCIEYSNKRITVRISYDGIMITIFNSKTAQRGIKTYIQKYGIIKQKAAEYYYSTKDCYFKNKLKEIII